MSLLIRKASERERLEAVLSKQTNRIKQALGTYLSDARSDYSLREVRGLLESRNIQGIMNLVNEHVIALGNVIPQAFVDAASMEAKTVVSGLRAANARVAISFDHADPRASSIMRNSRLQFVQQFSDSQRSSVRAALADAFENGEGPREAARAFRGAIGLTQNQWEAVENYRTLLENNSRAALSRELRDRRFDSTIASAIEDGTILEDSQIDRMTDRYRDTMINYRAENISRTEALRVTSQARQEATRQIMAQADIPDDRIRRTWIATRDKRTRDSHADMNGQSVIGNDTPFISGLGNEILYPGDPAAPPEDSINCRCQITVDILTPEEAEAV